MKIKSYLSSLLGVGEGVSKGALSLIDAVSEPKLKVAITTYYYQKPSMCGVAIHVQNLAKSLVKHGCEVHVFCHGDGEQFYKEDGVVVHTIGKVLTPAGLDVAKTRLEYDLFESEAVKAIIRENSKRKFDVIHTHGELVKAAFIFKKVYGIKWIHTFHAIEKLRVNELSVEEKEFGDLISWIESTTNYCDGAIFVSRGLMKEGVKHYKLKSKKVIFNGVDLSTFSYSPLEKKNVLFIGRFSKDKGIHLFPKIISEVMKVKDSSITLVCPYEVTTGELERIKDKLELQKKQFPGRINILDKPQHQEVIKELYRNCQVYVQPSKYESFGLCIIEAMATGRPVVAFRVGGIPEVIGDAGFAVKGVNSFIYKVKELLENRDECTRVGKMASKRAKKFDWDLIALETIKYYNEVRK